MHFWYGVVVTAVAVSAMLFVVNCGKKADPVCPGMVKPAAVSQLDAVIDQGAVVLTWSIQGGKADESSFRIFRSMLDEEGQKCLTCPRQYVLIADLSFQDSKLRWDGDVRVSYQDGTVTGHYLYSYKVLVCDADGKCSEESKCVDVTIP